MINEIVWPIRNKNSERIGFVNHDLDLPLHESWKTELSGSVLAPPVSSNKEVYVSSLGALYCINVDTGDVIWNFKCKELPKPKANALKASPALWKGRVYLSDMAGIIYCIDSITGKLIWENDEISARDESFNIVENRIYTRATRKTEEEWLFGYACLNMDGEEEWFYQSKGPYRTTSCAVKGGNLIFGDSCGFVYSVDANNGAEIWRLDIKSYVSELGIHFSNEEVCAIGMPVIVRDKVILRIGDYRNIAAISLMTGEVDWYHIVDRDRKLKGNAMCLAADPESIYYVIWNHFFRLDIESGEVVQEMENEEAELGDSFALEGLVVGKHFISGFNMSMKIAAFNVDTGMVEWEFTGKGGFSTPGIWIGGNLFMGSDSGHLFCFQES